MAFEAQPADTIIGSPTAQVSPDGAFDGHLEVRRLMGGLRAVSTVGGQHGFALVGEYQQRTVGSAEPGEISHIDQIGDQHRVQSGGTDFGFEVVSTLGMCHDP